MELQDAFEPQEFDIEARSLLDQHETSLNSSYKLGKIDAYALSLTIPLAIITLIVSWVENDRRIVNKSDGVFYILQIIEYIMMSHTVICYIYLRMHRKLRAISICCSCWRMILSFIYVIMLLPLIACLEDGKYTNLEKVIKVYEQKGFIMRRYVTWNIINIISQMLAIENKTSYLSASILTIYFLFEIITLIYDVYDIEGFDRINIVAHCKSVWISSGLEWDTYESSKPKYSYE